ncbi:MAG TPA: hypothetical protein VFZ31_11215, partial [Vicinamibacterales bacterium]
AGTRAASPVTPAARKRLPRTSPSADANLRGGTIAMWWITAAAIVIVAAIAFVLVTPNGFADWFPQQATTGAPPAPVTPPAPLPLPSPTEAYLTQARSLFASGKLRDALRALDRVPAADALRPDADRLRADIQRELLAVAGAEASSASSIAAQASPPR